MGSFSGKDKTRILSCQSNKFVWYGNAITFPAILLDKAGLSSAYPLPDDDSAGKTYLTRVRKWINTIKNLSFFRLSIKLSAKKGWKSKSEWREIHPRGCRSHGGARSRPSPALAPYAQESSSTSLAPAGSTQLASNTLAKAVYSSSHANC